jgi:NinB protein
MTRAALTLRTKFDRDRACVWAQKLPTGTRVEFRAPRRSLDQNSLMWELLTKIAAQVVWHGEKLNAEDWKDVLSASLRKARVVPGIDAGTLVPLGMRTSDMTKAEMSALIELVYAFGAEQGVDFGEA